MARYRITAPDGNKYEITGPENATNEELIGAVEEHLAKQPKTASGLEALKGGAKQLGRSFGTGIVGAFAPEEAAQRYLKETKEEPIPQATSLEAVKQKYLQSGFFPAAGEALSQVPGAILEQLPNIGVMATGARLGAMAGSTFGPVGTAIGGVGGAAISPLIQAFGGNIGRQAEEQRAAIEAGATPDISRSAAAAAALPQAGLDVAAQRLIFGKALVGKVLGRTPEEMAKLEGKALVAAERKAEKIAKEGLAKTATRGVVTGVIGEVPTEVAQQMLERAQAGLPLFDEKARDEYYDAAYGAALASPLGAVGSFSERGQAREDVAAREAKRQQAEAQLTMLGQGVGGVNQRQELQTQYDAFAKQVADLKEKYEEHKKEGNKLGMLDIDEQLDGLKDKEKEFQDKAQELGFKLSSESFAGPKTIEAEIAALEKQYEKAKTVEDRAAIREQLRSAYGRLDKLTAPEGEVPTAEGFTAPEPKKRGKKAKAGEPAVAGAVAVEGEEPTEAAPAPFVGPVIPARYTPEYAEALVQRLQSIETEMQKPKGVGMQAEKNRQANLFGAFNTLLEDARNLEYSKTDEELAEDRKDAAKNDLKTIEDRLNTLKERFLESAINEVKLAREENGIAPASEKELSDMTDTMDKLLTEIANRTATPNFNKRQGEAVDPEQERFNFSVEERRRLVEDYGLDENIDQQLALLTREINKRSSAAAKLGSVAPAERTARTDALASQNAGEIRRINAEIDSLYKDRADLLLNNLRAQLARMKNEVAYGKIERPAVGEAAVAAKEKRQQRIAQAEKLEANRQPPSPVEKPIPLEVTEEDKAAIEAAKKSVNDAVAELQGMRESGAMQSDIQAQVGRVEAARAALQEARAKPGQRLKAAKGQRTAEQLGKTAERQKAARQRLEGEQRELKALTPSETTETPLTRMQRKLDEINDILRRGSIFKRVKGKQVEVKFGEEGAKRIKGQLLKQKADLEKKIKEATPVKDEGTKRVGLLPYARAQRGTRQKVAQQLVALRKELRRKDRTPKQKEEIKDLMKKLRAKVKRGAITYEEAVPKLMQAGKQLARLKKRGSEIQQILSSQIDFAKKRTRLLADAAQARKDGNKELSDELVAERKELEKKRPNVAKLQAEFDQITKQIRDIENRPALKTEEQEIGEAERARMRGAVKKAEQEVTVEEPVDELEELKAKEKTKKQKTKKETTRKVTAEETAKAVEEMTEPTDFDDAEIIREALGSEFSMDANGNVYRRGAAETSVDKAEADALASKVKVPEGVKFVYSYDYAGLPAEVKAQLKDDGDTKGAVLPDGTIVVIGDAHANTADMESTIAHEVVGHYGVDTVLGPKGMKDLTERTMRMEGGIQKLAESFGKDVGEATLSTAIYYQRMADQARVEDNEKRAKELEEMGRIQAMRELIAHVEETRPNASFLQKANRFIKELVGQLRAALRRMGLKSFGLEKVTTSDIYKILKEARAAVGGKTVGAYVSPTGEVAFSKQKATYAANISEAAQRATSIVGSNRKTVQDILANNAGLQFATKFVDRFAPLERVAAFMKDSAQATQMMYFLRMHDQGIAWTQSVLTKGPLQIVKDDKGHLMLQTGEGPNVKKMVEALSKANVGNPEATKNLFTTYLLAERAEVVGYDKLKSDLGIGVSQKDLKEVLALGRNNAAFQEAKKLYNEHNNGLIDMLVASGAMSKEEAAKLKNKSYVPYYRVDKNGEVSMFLGGEGTVRIGDVKNQPYLHELVGGNEKILDVFASSVQNTRLLTDMALRNLATRNAAFGLQSAGMLKDDRIRDGDGPAAPNVIRFKIDGERKYAVVDSDKAGIPAELLVSGMEGIKVAMPVLVRALSAPAGLLRKFITRNPVYAMRQVIRDSTTNYFLTGADTKPVGDAAKNFYKLFSNKKDGSMPDLQSRGIVSGNVLTGTSEQMEKILLNMVSGKPGWEQGMAKLDIMAQHADEASRISIYNDFRKQGLSDMEATLATLESMNFNKRGTSPSIFMLNAMVPFLNAQIQGLNVLQKSLRGKMPFAERLNQRKKLVNRAMFMAATTMAYALMMQDDEAYESSDPVDRYNNWFVRVPGLDEPVRIPIPFEVGLLFKAIPEAMLDLARDDAKAEQAVYGITRLLKNSSPIGPSSLPAGIKPIVELTLGSSFYTGLPIESEREKSLLPEYRSRERTTEVAKSLGSLLGVSPLQVDYLINGYFAGTGLALAGLGNFILRAPDAPQPAEKTLSQMPVIGSLFQTNTGSGYINTFYRQSQELEQAKASFDALIKDGNADEAVKLVETRANDIALAGFASSMKEQLGKIREAEKLIRNSDMDPKEKMQTLKDLKISAGQLAKSASLALSSTQ